MAQAPDPITEKLAHFQRVCRDAGIKLTHQRIEIFREIASRDDHPDAEAVFHGVRQRLPSLSLDTVYRTLWRLADLGLVTTLGAPRERTRFDANLSRHHHFVCRHCGSTRDFYCPDFDALRPPAAVQAFGQIDTTFVEVRGLCHLCRAPQPPASPSPQPKEPNS